MNESYATSAAINRANAIGLNLSLANWREIFLAITDKIASDPPAANKVTAAFIGSVRDGGERWAIQISGRQFDVIYDPMIAKIVTLIRPREQDRQPAIVPRITPPLKSNTAAERTLENV